MAKDNKKKLSISPIAIIDNIVISKNGAWAYYVISEKPYDFLSIDSRIDLCLSTNAALAALSQSSVKKVDCHLFITNEFFNYESWENQVRYLHQKTIKNKSNFNEFDNFIQEQVKTMEENGYKKRVTYLGVKLTSRGSLFDISTVNPFEFGIREAYNIFKKSVHSVFMLPSEEISNTERSKLKDSEKEIYRIMQNTSFNGKKPTSEELLLVIKRRFYPSMPTPYLDVNYDERIGLSDIITECSNGTIEVKPRWLKFTQFIDDDIYEGYRTTLTFSKFPKNFGYPSAIPPFLYKSIILPFTISCRFSIIPVEKMKKEMERKKLELEDEKKNLIESGQTVNSQIKDTIRELDDLEDTLEEDKMPWLLGNYRITLEAETEEELKNYISVIKNEYAEQEFIITLSTGDQLELFKEEFIGSSIMSTSYQQKTSIDLIGVAGINYGGSSGNPVRQDKKLIRKG